MDKSLAAILDKCLELDPKNRYPNAQAILDALEKRQLRRHQLPLYFYGMAAPVLGIVLMSAVGLGLFP